jgi:DtxR family Mn-dependent transcriptional regulator
VLALDDVRLTDLPLGQIARVCRVLDDDPALLRYLSELGLVLGARLEVTEQVPFQGPLYVRLLESREVHALGAGVTDQVFVVADELPAD